MKTAPGPRVERLLGALRGSATGEGASAPYRVWARFALGFALVLLAGGAAVDVAARAAMKRDQAEHLDMLHDAERVALQTWFGAQEQAATLWATNPEVREPVERLVRRGGAAEPAELQAASERTALRALLGRVCEASGYSGFEVVDVSGRVVASSDDRRTEARTDWSSVPLLERVLEGDAAAAGVSPAPDVLAASARPVPTEAAIFVASPVRASDGRVLAALMFHLEPDRRLERLLSFDPTRKRPAETYAVDASGVFLTEPRFQAELRARGVLGPADAARFRLQARAPLADLGDTSTPVAPWMTLPFTKPVSETVSGRDGIDVEGYRSYHGRACIGRWSWLPDRQIGLVTEIERAEEMAVLAVPRLGWAIAIGMVLLSGAAGLISARLFSQVGKRLADVESMGAYRLVAPIGEGGMSTVYLARHRLLRRPTAVKVLRPDLVTKADLARFEREVQVTARLRHPNTVQVYDYGPTTEGGFFYAMELVPGLALDQLVDRFGPQPDGRVARILEQVCGSLGEAHALGFVHRDVKPSNVRLTDQGGVADFVVVLDFGLVREFALGGAGSLTLLSGIVGTPAFMPPEAFADPSSFGPRSDVYSVGAVGYYLLTGAPPFSAENAFRLAQQQIHDPIAPPSDRLGRSVDPPLEELVMRCLAVSADARPPDAAGLAAGLAECPSRSQWSARDARAWWDAHPDELEVTALDGRADLEDEPSGRVLSPRKVSRESD